MRVMMAFMMKYIGRFFGMAGSVKQAARRYIDAITYDDTVTGIFFASPAGKLVGPVEVQRQDHILHRPNQDVAYQATVSLAGADLNGFKT